MLARIMSHYAVAVGRKVGIFSTWPECQQQVTGFSGAKFKKFKTENEALEFIKLYSTCPPPTNNLKTYSKLDKNNSNTGGTCNIQSNQFKTLSLAQADLITKEMDKIEKSIAEGNKRISNLSKSKDANLLLEKPKKRTKLIDHSEINEAKKIKINDSDFIKDKDGFVEVYTDGSCTNNGSVKAKAGLGVYFGENNRLNVSEPVSGRATNNCGEIQAATKAIKLAHNEGIKKLCIKTDSQFLINSVTKWMKGWKRKGWKLASGEPVKNQIDFKELDSVLNILEIKWEYVTAHNGILGNERADQLAKAGAEQYIPH